jgi:broad specificity phosphatase PhoE
MVDKFIFVRHGESEDNSAGLWSTTSTMLTNIGVEQAESSAMQLKDKNITLILSSPYVRALQTAGVFAVELGIDPNKIIVVDEIREREWGYLAGKSRDGYDKWAPYSSDIEGTESRLELLKRVIVGLNKIKDFTKHTGNTLVIGHGISGYFLLQAAKGNVTLDKFEDPSRIENAGYIEVEILKT